MSETCGVIFVATGRKHYQWAVEGARSVRATNPDIPITLFSDCDGEGGPFTDVRRVDQPHRRSKVDYMARTPYDRTIYLDADCRVTSDLKPVFALLDRFDFAAAHAHNRPDKLRGRRSNIPASFPEINSGVIAYRCSKPVLAALSEWAKTYHQAGFKQDQITLREILWAHPLKIYVLPPEYNFRGHYKHAPRIRHVKMKKWRWAWSWAKRQKLWKSIRKRVLPRPNAA